MRIAITVWMTLVSSVVHAEVYKCTTETGRVIYQSSVCAEGGEQSEITIQSFDHAKIEKAQAELKQEVAEWREAKRKKAEAERGQVEQAAKDTEEAERRQSEMQRQEVETLLRINHGRSRGYYRQSDLYERIPQQ